MAKPATELKDRPKHHDDKAAEAQATVDAGKTPDKLGSPAKDTEAGKLILETASENPEGREGTGHSTQHVTGMPEAAEEEHQKPSKLKGMATPSIGRIVVYREGDYEVSAEGGGSNPEGTNGTREHPAIVTRAWPNGFVNLIVFLDGNGTVTRISVAPLGVSQDEAPEGVQVSGGNACWSWPEKV